jgi:hypothetical protein
MFVVTKRQLKQLFTPLILCSLFLIECGDVAFAKKLHYEWKMFHEDMVEPPLSKMLGWGLDEIPRNVTIYYDLNSDGRADVVFSHPVIAYTRVKDCAIDGKNKIDKYYLTLTTCPSKDAYKYFATVSYTMFRKIDSPVWSKVMQMVGNR